MNEGSRMMRKNSQWMIHSFHVLKIGLKNTTLRAQFFTLLFFHLLCPLWILGWELFFKKNFHYSIFTNSFQHFWWAWLNRKNTKNDWNTTQTFFGEFNSKGLECEIDALLLQAICCNMYYHEQLFRWWYRMSNAFYGNKRGWIIALALSLWCISFFFACSAMPIFKSIALQILVKYCSSQAFFSDL